MFTKLLKAIYRSTILYIRSINMAYVLIGLFITILPIMSACSNAGDRNVTVKQGMSVDVRDNTPSVLVPEKGGSVLYGNEDVIIDATNQENGYLYVSNTGEVKDVKVILRKGSSVDYSYSINGDYAVIPLSEGSGMYEVIGYESIGNGAYAMIFDETMDIAIKDEFIPFLYPNQYVEFDATSQAVNTAKDLAEGAHSDLEVVANVYYYVIDNMEYDQEEADTVEKGYLPNVEEIMNTKKGICFDYAALMTAMLRTQRIPTKLVIGYAGDTYHAWISTYVKEIGWIDNIIEFDGVNWSMMDPTFADNTSTKKFKEINNEKDYYIIKYVH